jgi:hypothetical protein
MSLSSRIGTDEVTVRTYDGESAYGATHLPERRVRVRVDGERILVRNQGGDEVVSEMRLHALPRLTDLDSLERDSAFEIFTPESLVTVGDYETRVMRTQNFKGRARVLYVLVTLA